MNENCYRWSEILFDFKAQFRGIEGNRLVNVIYCVFR